MKKFLTLSFLLVSFGTAYSQENLSDKKRTSLNDEIHVSQEPHLNVSPSDSLQLPKFSLLKKDFIETKDTIKSSQMVPTDESQRKKSILK